MSCGRLPMATAFRRDLTLDLDGIWDFRLCDRPEAVRREDLTGPAAGCGIEVPGCWTMQGHDRPQYTNTAMPFPGPPPEVPDANPTGVYRRRIEIPAGWAGQRVVLHVGGAESVLYVHVDGRPVGMGKDSRLPQEFDLTPFVVAGGEADLALTVVRWSDATYLEDQDHWYHAGLHRSVWLQARPAVHIADVHARADFDPVTRRGHLALEVRVEADPPAPRGWEVAAVVGDHAGRAPVRFEHPTNTAVNLAAFRFRGAGLDLDVGEVEPWSAETPVLHPLRVALVDDAGTEVDAVDLWVGFRRVEVLGAELLVNGRAVLIRGVNRHDHDPRRGKAVTAASIEDDVALMKRHNLDAIRTSHYPNDPVLYEICDRLGMYVVDEADIETHAYLRSLTRDPRWGRALLERVTRMALRDKNHPSVIVWSLGNESGVSPFHHAAAAWLRAWDPTRPVQYEGGISEDQLAALVAGEAPDLPVLLARRRPETDLVAPMYPPVEALVAWARDHQPHAPLIMCEYAHAMGNAGGGLDRYWDAIRAHHGLQGGFVWDWVDQALVQELPGGRERLAYGGDFGDEPNDGPFCLNGVVAADRTPHPALVELAAVVAPVRVDAVDAARGWLRVRNERSFTDLADLVPSWSVAVDGVEVVGGRLAPLGTPPGGEEVLRIPVPAIEVGPGQVAHLDVRFARREAASWAPAGHLVAHAQFAVGRGAGPAVAPAPERAWSGTLDDLEPALQLWRAPIDNEVFGPGHARRWQQLGLPEAAAERAPLDTLTTAATDGGVLVQHSVNVPAELDDIARVGVRLHVGPGVDRVEWLGRGPHENYRDRSAAATVGRWTTAVDEWGVAYVHPQASGNRTGVRWLRLLDADGRALLTIDHLDDLEVTVARVVEEEVAVAAHREDLPVRDDCYVWIDARHRGVGTGAVGPDTAPEYRLAPGSYRWSYRLR